MPCETLGGIARGDGRARTGSRPSETKSYGGRISEENRAGLSFLVRFLGEVELMTGFDVARLLCGGGQASTCVAVSLHASESQRQKC